MRAETAGSCKGLLVFKTPFINLEGVFFLFRLIPYYNYLTNTIDLYYILYYIYIRLKSKPMKPTKKYSECSTVDDFIDYYYDASRSELKAVKKSLEAHNSGGYLRKRELEAVTALLV